MKKTFRAIATAIIIAIIALSSTVAAFASYDTIVWADHFDDVNMYPYGGEISLGATTIINGETDENIACFTFEAENSGYYLIETTNDSWVFLPETYDEGHAYGYSTYDEIGNEAMLFNIEKGEALVAVNFYDNFADEIIIEYYGEEVADFTVEENVLNSIIIGYDMWTEWDSFITTDTVITFSNGNTLELEDHIYYVNPVTEEKEGKGKLTIEFGGKEKEFEFIANTEESFISMIESVEVKNVEDNLIETVDFCGFTYHDDITEGTLTVNFTDGSTYEAEIEDNYAEIVFPDGRVAEAYVGGACIEEDEYAFVVSVAGEYIKEYEYETEKEPVREGVVNLGENIRYRIDNVKYYSTRGIQLLASDPVYAMQQFREVSYQISCIFDHINSFIRFYI